MNKKYKVMTFKKTCLVNLVFIICSLSVFAQGKMVMNLEQMLEFAKQNNYEINEANLEKLKSEQKIREVRGNGLPQVNSEIDYKQYLKLPTSIFPGAVFGSPDDMAIAFGKKHNVDVSFQFSQLLFSLKYINGLKTAKKAYEINGLQVEKAQIEMVDLLLTEYYNLMAIYKNLEIIESNMKSLNQMKKKIKALASSGLALQTDLDKITINISSIQANKEQLLAAVNVQTNNLKYIIGLDSSKDLQVDTSNFNKMFQVDNLVENNKKGLNVENLTDIKLIDKAVELNKLQIKTEQAEKYPNIALYGSYMYQGIRDEFNFLEGGHDWFNVQVVGVKATIPIFTGFSNNARIKSAKYEMQISQGRKKKAISGLKLQYSNALMEYNSSIRNCQIQKQNIDLAKNVRHLEEVKYNEGMSTLTDLLISEKELRNTEINYAQNFITMKQAEIKLLKSKGQLFNYQLLNK